MRCRGCGRAEELRLGWCFDCSNKGERRAACRSVLQHLMKAALNLCLLRFKYVGYDLSWAWQRLTRTGDYAKDGYFDWVGYEWRR